MRVTRRPAEDAGFDVQTPAAAGNPEPVDLVFYVRGFPPWETGGPATAAYHLAQEYAKDRRLGHLTLIVQTAAAEEEIRARLGSPPSLTVIPLNYYLSLREIGVVLRAAHAIRDSGTVHFNEFPFRHLILILLASLQGKARILSLHGLLSGEVNAIFGGSYPFVVATARHRLKFRFPRGTARLLLAVYRRFASAWSAVVVPSHAIARRAMEEDGYDPSLLVVIPHGIREPTHPAAAAPHDGPLRLLYVGNLEPVKGPDLLLDALERLQARGIALDVGIVGDGSLAAPLRRRADALRSHRITFHGRLVGDAVDRLYLWSDLVVIPSRFESFSLVLLEAMASRRPVVATNVGGVPEIARDGRNAILVGPTPGAIEQGILRLLQDASLRDAMAQANGVDAARFTWPVSASRYLALYERLSGEGSPATPGFDPSIRGKDWVSERVIPGQASPATQPREPPG